MLAGVRQLATTLYSDLVAALDRAKKEHREHLARLSHKKRKTGEGAAPGGGGGAGGDGRAAAPS
eukprot:4084068-Pyramimonas_sp.AAC.1